ncbi:MAG: AAA family ATPase [Candidatus Sumerlaeota bacterium]|nr:AAA family ATPase [Candidatus Sumerlaeota bacterium]
MIRKVRLKYFKQFEDQEFDLSDHVILAGPNNSGKTTLLQVISVWQLALRRWLLERGAKTKAKKRAAIPVTRKDFTAVPLREMNLLWTNTSVSLRKDDVESGKPGFPRIMEIALEGEDAGKPWELAIEFRYQSTEQIYIKPCDRHIEEIPLAITREDEPFRVVHIPPFSGIGSEETLYVQPAYQDLLIGQGKAGDILRNLLLEVYQKSPEKGWLALCRHVEEIFAYRLLPPQHEGRPFILCEYLRGIPKGKGTNGLPQLDVASAGSGFHQVLLLLAFFYARPATVLLLDEPDAHLHLILQKQIYNLLRRIAAQQRCQLIISTHAEVLIDNTGPENIISFYHKPHRLIGKMERDQLREALKWLPATDILQAERSPGVLYLEGPTDFDLLQAWADVLRHPMKSWFADNPFWHCNQGRNPAEAKGHFFALQAIKPSLKGCLLLDGDNRQLQDHEVKAEGLIVARWKRYEIESYLLHPTALMRFVQSRAIPLAAAAAEEYLRDRMPPSAYRDPLKPQEYFEEIAASKTLLPGFFKSAQVNIDKEDYFQICQEMRPEEIPDEVKQKLNRLALVFGILSPK